MDTTVLWESDGIIHFKWQLCIFRCIVIRGDKIIYSTHYFLFDPLLSLAKVISCIISCYGQWDKTAQRIAWCIFFHDKGFIYLNIFHSDYNQLICSTRFNRRVSNGNPLHAFILILYDFVLHVCSIQNAFKVHQPERSIRNPSTVMILNAL